MPVVGLGGLVSLPFQPTIALRSSPPTKRKPRTSYAERRLGWVRPPLPPASCSTILSPTTPSATSIVTGHTETPSTPSPPKNFFVGSISTHDIATDSLASSANGAVDTGAPPGSIFRPPFVLPIAHHWRLRFSPSLSFVGPFPSQSCHRSVVAAGHPRSIADHGFLRQHLWSHCQDYRSPRHRAPTSRPKLRLHFSFAARAPPSPALHRSRYDQTPPKAVPLHRTILGAKRALTHGRHQQPWCTVTVGYFRRSTLTITAASTAS